MPDGGCPEAPQGAVRDVPVPGSAASPGADRRRVAGQ
ncbi:hypothetical protein A4G23_00356 [Streptomyces rubrolavendulae]|uniref:Uncharacterized protein n=1 Tax=Streptomyces rubrolavendulae TaxID=285473 RepID=A0A1D8FWH9_9ACTN|nr:hypothetical protein A4G23_00356 [Streptomyces rubrolavendulae]